MNISEKDLTKLATIKTQSEAKYFAKIDSIDEVEEVLTFVDNNALNLFILGNGTNILFTKKNYYDTVFIKLGKSFDFFKLKEYTVELGASCSFMRTGKKLVELGYCDFIYMTLIPGSLGGGVRQNAGTTKEGEVKDNFISAKVYDLLKKRTIMLNKDEMDFSYRNSLIQKQPNRYLVLSAIFSLGKKVNDISNLLDIIKEKKSERKLKQPTGNSFGSTFKSLLQGKPAWYYIDEVGLRNRSIGGARFSKKHSNWIINDNNADANDILLLIKEAKEKVLEKFEINLEVEIELI